MEGGSPSRQGIDTVWFGVPVTQCQTECVGEKRGFSSAEGFIGSYENVSFRL